MFMENTADIKFTPLKDEHIRVNAKMAPFAGWYMPIQYEGIIAEHNHTRRAASLFDVCHMGEFYVRGDAAETGLERLFSFSVTDMPVGRCRYGAMLNERGGIIDDLVAYRLSLQEWMIVVNAGALGKDAAHIKAFIKKTAYFENRSDVTAKLDLQGPMSGAVLADLITPDISKLRYYTFNYFDILGEKDIISRTGYTGELGYEIYTSAAKSVELWRLLLKDKRVKPAGLGARDTLRLEMGYTLYGQDVDENTTPLEADIGRFINFERDFIGRDVLAGQRKAGAKRLLVAFQSRSRKSPRRGYLIMKDGIEIGMVTSGSFSPSLSCGIGLGYVEQECAKPGSQILIKDAGTEIEAVIVDKPFYKRGTARDGGVLL